MNNYCDHPEENRMKFTRYEREWCNRCGCMFYSVDQSWQRPIEWKYDTEIGDTRGINMLLWCPECGKRHIDEGKFASKLHHTHACQHCGHVWRPAIVHTTGVQFLPGFKNEG